jgi:hypothetical protein
MAKGRHCISIVILLGLIGILTSCAEKNAKLDPEIMGKWVTDDSVYSDRSIEISRDMLILGTGTGPPGAFLIKNVKLTDLADGRVYFLKCETSDGDELNFEFRLETRENVKVLKLRNQDQIEWMKISK